MSEDLLEQQDVDVSVLVHERGRRVAQLMDRIALESGFLQRRVDDVLDRLRGDPLLAVAEEQRLLVLDTVDGADLHVVVDGGDAGVVEVDGALFVALAGDLDRVVVPNVRVIEADEL